MEADCSRRQEEGGRMESSRRLSSAVNRWGGQASMQACTHPGIM